MQGILTDTVVNMYILYFIFYLYEYFSFLGLIYSVADEEPHFVRYSAINHYLLTYLLTYLLGGDTTYIFASPIYWKRDCILYVFIPGHAKVYCSRLQLGPKGIYLAFLLRPLLLIRPQESNPNKPALQ